MKRSVRGLTIIRNDTAHPGRGIGRLVQSGCVAKAIVSHLGANPVTQQKIILAIARTLPSAGGENSFRSTPDSQMGLTAIIFAVSRHPISSPSRSRRMGDPRLKHPLNACRRDGQAASRNSRISSRTCRNSVLGVRRMALSVFSNGSQSYGVLRIILSFWRHARIHEAAALFCLSVMLNILPVIASVCHKAWGEHPCLTMKRT
jgi:hypothetical protein